VAVVTTKQAELVVKTVKDNYIGCMTGNDRTGLQINGFS
jgi:hypothetical protein